MPPSRREILDEIERQKKAYYEHLDKAERSRQRLCPQDGPTHQAGDRTIGRQDR